MLVYHCNYFHVAERICREVLCLDFSINSNVRVIQDDVNN